MVQSSVKEFSQVVSETVENVFNFLAELICHRHLAVHVDSLKINQIITDFLSRNQ